VIDVIAGSSEPCVAPNTDTSNNLTISFKTGIGSVSGNAAIVLYPNPNNGRFVLSGTIPSGAVQLDIYDALGRMVYSEKAIATHDEWKQELHLRDILPGVYYLRLTSATGSDMLVFTVK
jgi:hypothetical protein